MDTRVTRSLLALELVDRADPDLTQASSLERRAQQRHLGVVGSHHEHVILAHRPGCVPWLRVSRST